MSIPKEKIFPYVFNNLPVLDLESDKVVELSGYTPAKGFVWGLSEFKTKKFTPYFRSLVSISKEDHNGNVVLLQILGEALNIDVLKTGKPATMYQGMEIEYDTFTLKEDEHQAWVSLYNRKEKTKLYLTIGEKRGLAMYMQPCNVDKNGNTTLGHVENLPFLNISSIIELVNRLHIWIDDQSVFKTGAAIDYPLLKEKNFKPANNL